MKGNRLSLADALKMVRLAHRRLFSPQDYQALEEFQGQLLVKYLKSKGVDLSDEKVLDLGSGFGGYTQSLEKSGASVLALDQAIPREITKQQLICADATQVPIQKDSFDLTISISLIEHLPDPQRLINEMKRMTRAGGFIYLSFPPFYSPVGGHHFSPWHLLGEKVAVWFFSKRKWYVNEKWTDKPYDFKSFSYNQAFGSYGLYPLKISAIRKMILSSGLELIDQSVKYSPINISKLPIIGEFLTWQVQFLTRKLL